MTLPTCRSCRSSVWGNYCLTITGKLSISLLWIFALFLSTSRLNNLFFFFSHCNCAEISKFSQSLLINVSTVGGIYLDNGFGYFITDNRGNEEATWQEIVRGDVKRLSIWRFSTKRSPYTHVASRRILSRQSTSRHITTYPISLNVTPHRHHLESHYNVKLGSAQEWWYPGKMKFYVQLYGEQNLERKFQDVFFEYWMIASH